jgi:hypothetical protein
MKSELLEHIFEVIQSCCNYTIEAIGDRPLSSSIDPLTQHGAKGGRVVVESTSGQRLTFSILEDTMRGLTNVLIYNKLDSEAEFQIYHANLGMVGIGNVTDRSGVWMLY